MKKLTITFALALILMASSAQAAIFTFDNLSAGTDISNFSIDGGDVEATFTGFTNAYGGTIYDYFNVPSVGATIQFDAAALVSEIISADWGTEQPFSGMAYLGTAQTAFSSFADIIGGTWDSIFIDGTFGISKIVATAAPTPIPAAFLLLGSGLVGLVGLRRKFQQ